MSAHGTATNLPADGELISQGKIRLAKILSLLIGLPASGVVFFLLFFRSGDAAHPAAGDQASYSYLFAVSFFLTLGFGSLFWILLHHATNSGWGIVVRRQMENLAAIVPWSLVLMAPFWCPLVREDLWEWEPEAKVMVQKAEELVPAALKLEMESWEAERDQLLERVKQSRVILERAGNDETPPGQLAALKARDRDLGERLSRLESGKPTETTVKVRLMKQHDPMLAGKFATYFHGGYGAAYVRLAAYTVVFTLIVWLLRNWSLRTDQTKDAKFFLRSRYWSCFFIIPFALGYTFLMVDLLMALNYKWYSTMWGVYLFAGAALSSMALLILVVTWLRSLGHLRQVVTEEHYHLMGKLLFAFCVFWAYIAFSQYFLIWYSNITEETQFFLLRNSGGWNVVSIVLVVGHFFVPFVILLWRPVKKTPALLSAVSVWILLMHLLDMYWIVIPERAPSLTAGGGEPQLWMAGALGLDILSLLGVGGLLAFVFLQVVGRSSLYPCGDPRLAESVHVEN